MILRFFNSVAANEQRSDVSAFLVVAPFNPQSLKQTGRTSFKHRPPLDAVSVNLPRFSGHLTSASLIFRRGVFDDRATKIYSERD